MKFAFRSLLAAVVLAGAAASSSAAVVYTTSATFLPLVASGAYTNNFNGLGIDPPTSYSGNGYAYTLSAPQGLYSNGDFVGTNQIDEALTITFTSGTVTALGANFFVTNISDTFQSVSMTLNLSDGTSTTFTAATLADSYRGFISDVAITSLTIASPGQSLYGGLDNFTVGTALVENNVPEPGSLALLGLGLAGLAAARRRQQG